MPKLKPTSHETERGFTLIEMMISLLILSMITAVVGTMFLQTSTITLASKNHIEAINAVQNAGQWIVRDGEQATNVIYSTSTLTLQWDYSAIHQGAHTIVYSVSGTDLLRTDNEGIPAVIATGINDASTDFVVSGLSGSSYRVDITCTVGTFKTGTATQTYYFKLRAAA